MRLVPETLFKPDWIGQKNDFCNDLQTLTTANELAHAALRLEGSLRPACFGVFWRDAASKVLTGRQETELWNRVIVTTANDMMPKDYFTSVPENIEEDEIVEEEDLQPSDLVPAFSAPWTSQITEDSTLSDSEIQSLFGRDKN